MQLNPAGREFANFTITNAGAGALEVSTDEGASWHPLTSAGNGTIYRALVAGPDADPTDAIVLRRNSNPVWVRLTATPEVVIRNAGTIVVTDS